MTSVALVTVISGKAYETYARKMFDSAERWFRPCQVVQMITLAGHPGWPWATLYRHHHLIRNLPDSDYVFLIDADMRFDGKVGDEILGDGVTATLHPGYVDVPLGLLPFESREESTAYVSITKRKRYFCGGFIGGRRNAYHGMAEEIRRGIDVDMGNKVVAVWHDESHLNKHLSDHPPSTVLSPSYCYPADARYYEQCIWKEKYEPKITALDKTMKERGVR